MVNPSGTPPASATTISSPGSSAADSRATSSTSTSNMGSSGRRQPLAVGPEEDRGVGELLARDPLGDAARDQVDAQLPGPAGGRGQRGAVERLGGGAQGLGVSEDGPFLRQHHQLGAVPGGGSDSRSATSRLRS